MLVLGIESTCDETGAAVVRDGREVVSNIVASQSLVHEKYGGVVPEIASREHERVVVGVVDEALREAGVALSDLDAVAVAHRPGLIGALLVGLSAAKALAWSAGLPLVGVDHVQAHLYSGVLDQEGDPELPALGVVVSGGHSSIYRMGTMTEMVRLGATIDDAIGEAFDKAANILGLGYPGGPHIDRLASMEDADDRAFSFPIARLERRSLDMSFSGLKTALLYEARGRPAPRRVRGKPPLEVPPVPELTYERKRDLAASFQRAAVRALILKIDRALAADKELRSVVIGGGVSANSALRTRAKRLCDRRNVKLVIPEMRYCTDNAAMIAGLGSRLFQQGKTDSVGLVATPTPSV